MKHTRQNAYVVTLPPPTPNGGLHIGHLSGPFLSADVFSRAARLIGSPVFTSCYSDINQSYVRITAQRQKRDPDELAEYWTRDIIKTLEEYSIDVNDYFPVDNESKDSVRSLFHRLYREGVLVKKSYPIFHSCETGDYLDEAGVSGFCPTCLSHCNCGICESCSCLNDPTTLLTPSVTLTGEKTLKVEKVEVMVLELERYRQHITSFYEQDKNFRPRFRWLVEDALQNKLPDFPVTMPGNWGIDIEHSDFPGQVINPWPEIMAQQIYSYKRAISSDVSVGPQPRFINFYGFDNSYFYAIVHATMMSIIDNGRWLPFVAINNEFYNLDHLKFSTSRNHVIWSREFLSRYTADEIRFYAAWNNPGFEKSNFNEEEMGKVLDRGLHSLWARIAADYNTLILNSDTSVTEPSAGTVSVGAAAIKRIFDGYSAERFHLRQAAEDILHFMEYIKTHLESGEVNLVDASYLIKCFALAIFPVMPSAGEALHRNITGVSVTQVNAAHSLTLKKLPVVLV